MLLQPLLALRKARSFGVTTLKPIGELFSEGSAGKYGRKAAGLQPYSKAEKAREDRRSNSLCSTNEALRTVDPVLSISAGRRRFLVSGKPDFLFLPVRKTTVSRTRLKSLAGIAAHLQKDATLQGKTRIGKRSARDFGVSRVVYRRRR